MGFLDRFRKNDNAKPSTQPLPNLEKQKPPFEVKYSVLPNGNLEVEFYNRNAEFKKFYDTTRLIIGKQALNMAGHAVCNCAVSWYGKSDQQRINKETGKLESPRAGEYKGVLAELDVKLLQTDPNYCSMVMQNLMDKQRVERYLEEGLRETPEVPCGKYIGGVGQSEKGYTKFFEPSVGLASHNTDLMRGRRRERQAMAERARQKSIQNKKAEIARLQNEVNSLEDR